MDQQASALTPCSNVRDDPSVPRGALAPKPGEVQERVLEGITIGMKVLGTHVLGIMKIVNVDIRRLI